MRRIPFFMHDLGEAEVESVRRVLQSPILTTGDVVEEFERRFAELLGVQHAIGLTSCTGALHLSLLALGIGPGDEVITTPMTFVATALAILKTGATPVFVDVEPDTGNLDAQRVEDVVGERTRAIVPVHLFGEMCDMTALGAIAERHGLHIVEDAAHCVEGRRDGVAPGQIGATACFSFYATKNLTCGEGGAVVTNDLELAQRLRALRLHGMTKTAIDRERHGYSHWDVMEMGWKYNMDNIQAALLLPQFDRLWDKWSLRQELYERYRLRLEGIPGLRVLKDVPKSRHARHLLPVLIEEGQRDAVISALEKKGVAATVNYRAIHLLSYLREKLGYGPGSFPLAEAFGDAVLSLPFYPTMPERDVDDVATVLGEVMNELET